MLTAIVIDDEPLARDELAQLLNESGRIEVLAQASNAIAGLKMINEFKPQVVFLDIQMPQITGTELLAMLDTDSMPYVVFVTAYDQYAIQAFEDNAFDYLLKPVEPERLQKTLQRLERALTQADIQRLQKFAPQKLSQIPCMGHQRIVIIPADDIECAYTDISGVHVCSAKQTASTQLTLKTLEQKTALIHCHRQYLVNVAAISEIKLLDNGLAEISTHSGFKVPVSRRYLKVLKEILGIAGN